jgi:acetyl-CoA carboxylase biotin carboxylase subunit
MIVRKILVANRGEIACRIMRTCADMGVATVGVFSDVDAGALHVRAAGEAVRLLGSATGAYLDMGAILEAARRTGADAVHPGYGFLAENASFAAACRDAGITFIGPTPEVIQAMGSKRQAKEIMAEAGVPVVPGYQGEDQSEKRFRKEADALGYPIMIKASAGGGGKGMRLVASRSELPEALAAARREAMAAFGDGSLILEKFIDRPRHVEFQIFGDVYGNVIHLGERECTIQRRYQKVVEETPSPALTPELRARMGAAAVSAGRKIGYTNAGTVEFILAPDASFYFLEVNTRLQVEHAVTELVTGLDLVRWQIQLAEGDLLPLGQDEVTFTGHAVEARVYAEDPASDFLPATGPVLLWRPPEGNGVRVDAGLETGDAVSAYYDPMLAKITAWGAGREEALRRLDHALATTVLLGVRHNMSFLRRLILHPAHAAGDISTAFLEQHGDELLASLPSSRRRETAAVAVAVARSLGAAETERWRNNPQAPLRERFLPTLELRLQPTGVNRYEVTLLDEAAARTLGVVVHKRENAFMTLELNGHLQSVWVVEAKDGEWWVQVDGATEVLFWCSPMPQRNSLPSHHAGSSPARSRSPQEDRQAEAVVTAPMPGAVVSVLVEEGQSVVSGDPLLVLSAMKMEHTLRAPRAGTIARVYCRPGEQVVAATALVELAD